MDIGGSLSTPRPARDQPPAEAARREPAWGRRAAFALLALLGAAFLIQGWATITGPLGDSHDGRNGGVWARASRSLRENGPVDSRLGARAGVGGEEVVYANHPPLIIAEAAAVETVAGERPWATRAPAWLASLALIPLLYLLVRELGVPPLASAVGVVIGLGTPMFFAYGTMLDTPVTALPIAVALLLLWVRSGRSERPSHPVLVASVAALTVLASWQGLAVAALVVAWGAGQWFRQRHEGAVLLARLVPVAAGALAGVAMLLAWAWWSHGSLGFLVHAYDYRTGQTTQPVSLLESIDRQWSHLQGLIPPVLLIPGAIGLWIGLRRSATRPVIAILLIVTVGYSLVLRQGASLHSYWNYWLLVPLAIGLAIAVDAVVPRLQSRSFSPEFVGALLVAVTALLVAVGVSGAGSTTGPTTAAADAGRLAHSAEWPADQEVAWYSGLGEPPSFLEYYARRASARLTPRSTVASDELVLVRLDCGPGATAAGDWEYALLRAGDPRVGACWPGPR